MATSSKLKIQWPGSSTPAQEDKKTSPESDVSQWDPMLDDYTSPTFNCYQDGTPGSFLPSVNAPESSVEEGAKGWLKQSQSFRDKQNSSTPRKENGSSLKTTYDHSKNVTLYVSGIPIGLSEEGFANLFENIGTVKKTRLVKKDNDKNSLSNTCFGFVEFGTVREADAAIQQLDQTEMGKGITLRVRISESKGDREKRLAKKQEENSFLSTLSTVKHTVSNGHAIEDDVPTDSNIPKINNKPLGVEGKPVSPWSSLNKSKQQTPEQSKSNSIWSKLHTHSQDEKVSNSPSYANPSPPHYFTKTPESQPMLQSNNADQGSTIKGGEQICAYCKNPGKKRCVACKTHYCSKECQTNDWPSHKLVCKSQGGKTVTRQMEPVDDGINEDFHLAVPTKQIGKLLGLQPAINDTDPFQSTDAKNFTSLSSSNTTDSLQSGAGVSINIAQLNNEANLPPLPPETPPDSPPQSVVQALPSIKTFSSLPSSFPVSVLRASAASSVYIQVQCQEVQKANNEFKAMIKSGDFQPQLEHTFAKNRCCIVKTKNGQFKVAKIRAYKKNAASVITSESIFAVVSKEDIFIVPQSFRCLADSIFKFQLYDVLPFEGTDRDEASRYLESLTIGKLLTCTVVSSHTDFRYVRLTDPSSGESINQLMGESDYAVLLSSMSAVDPGMSVVKITFLASSVAQHFPLVGKHIEILPQVIVNPNMIWAQENHDHISNFKQLSVDMNMFFSKAKSKSYHPSVGELCAAFWDQSWHRAEILSVSGSTTYNIMLVDMGIKTTVTCSNLKNLEEHKFITLPRQAFLVSLSGVQPIDPSGIWENSAIEFLKNRISGRRVGAEVLFVRGNIFSVRMIDPMSVDSLTVNQLLVSEGFAKALLGETSGDHTAQSTAMPTKAVATPTAVAAQLTHPTSSTPSKIVYYQGDDKPSNKSQSSKENSQTQPNLSSHADNEDSLKATESQVSVATQDTDSSEVTSRSFSEPKVEEKVSSSDLSSHSSHSSTGSQKPLTLAPTLPKISPAVAPPLETEWLGMVSHCDDPKSIWVVPVKQLEAFAKVVTSTAIFCQQTRMRCQPQVGFACLAPFENHHYRCEVLSIEQQAVTIKFADFGNTETVQLSDILAVNKRLCETPSLAICCELDRITYPNGESDYSEDCKKFFQTNVADRRVIVQIHKDKGTRVAVSMQVAISAEERVDLSYELVKRGFAAFVSGLQTPLEGQSPEDTSSASCDLPKVKPLVRAYQRVVLPKSCQVGITSVDSPSQFWVIHVMEDGMSKLDLVNKELNNYATSSTAGPISSDLVAGCLCCARFSEDNTWYRAVVLSCDGSNYTVRFLDYGNQCVAGVGDMRVLPSSFLSLPAQAVQCKLHEVQPLQTNWSAEAVLFLKSNMQSAVFNAKSHGRINGVVVLELVDSDGQSLAEQMISAGLAKSTVSPSASDKNTANEPPYDLDLPTSENFQASVTYAVSPLEFWIQSKDMEKQQSLNTLMETLQSFYSDQSNHHHVSPAIGSAYCSKYEDGFYYRCMVVEIFPDNGTVKVLYIDFGNSSTIQASSLLQLQPQFTTFNKFAAKCSLSGFSSAALNPSLSKQFIDMTLGQVMTCTYVHKAGDSVRLGLCTSNGWNLIDILKKIGTTVNPSAKFIAVKPSAMPSSATQVLVSAVNSPSSIFVQIVTSENHKIFAKITEQLQSYCSMALPIEPSVGNFCSAMFKEDKSWYRAKILSVLGNKAKVMYVDFGNQAEVPCQYIKPLSPDLAEPAAFALEVSLSVEPAGDSQWSQASQKSLQQLIENKSFLMKPLNKENLVDFVDESQQGSEASVTQLVEAGVAKEKGSTSAKKQSGVMNGHHDSHTSSPTESCSGLPQQCSDSSDAPAEICKLENIIDIALEGNKESYEVLIIHIASLGELYVIATDHVEKFGELINKVQARAEIPTHFNRSLVPGELCLAKFSEDSSWYRAEVVELQESDGLVVVHFVDFGNNDTVSLSSLLPISKELFNVPLVTFTCALYGVPYAAFSDVNIVKALNSMTQSKKLLCKVVNRVPLIVDISDPEDPSGLTLVEQLCYPGSLRNISASDNIRVPLTIIPTDDYMVGMVTEAKGPREFYMQIISSKIIPSFQKMCAKLEECKELAPATDPIYIGQLVCGLSTAYNTCYRARVITLPSDKEATVHYVDFGNQETIPLTQVWPMKNDFQYIPFMSVRCCLVEFENVHSIPSHVVEKFSSLVTDKQLQVRQINAQPPYGSTVVELVDTTQATDVVVHKALKATAT